MKRILLMVVSAVTLSAVAFSQENHINRIPSVGKDINQQQYTTFDSGVWVAAEILGGYSMHFSGHNMTATELDVTVGYRFNEFFKVGAGLGARYYIDQGDLRRHDLAWGMPLYAAFRGNMIPGEYRKVVPYWGFEIGGCVRDGFMFRPTVGMKIGEPRQSFTLGIVYMGQNIATYNHAGGKKGRFTSFLGLRLGYEF